VHRPKRRRNSQGTATLDAPYGISVVSAWGVMRMANWSPSLNRPCRDGRVDLRHEGEGFLEGCDYLQVVLQVVTAQGAATPVFEPLCANLIPAGRKREEAPFAGS